MKRGLDQRKPIGGIALAVLAGVAPLDAQEAQTGVTIDEMIVTAQKRAQNLQEVPIAVSAFDADGLAKRGVRSSQDLQFFVPSLTIGETNAAQTQVTLRGVGSENIGIGGDPGVALYVDGHYLQSSNYITQDFFDVERVEVLRGPQGTLYGRNAVGGAINIVTQRPTQDLDAKLQGEITNYSGRKVSGVINVPLTPELAFRAAIVDEDRDGFTENLATGRSVDSSDYTAIRASALAAPSENLEFFLSGYLYESNTDRPVHFTDPYPVAGPAFFIPFPLGGGVINPYFGAVGLPVNPTTSNNRVILNEVDATGGDDAHGASLDVAYEFGDFVIKSLSSYNDIENRVDRDLDGSDQIFTSIKIDFSYETFSQELQFNYLGERYSVVSGLYYYQEDSSLSFDLDSYNFFGIPGTTSTIDLRANNITTSFGAFAQLDADLTEDLRFAGGVRFTRDKKEFVETSVFPDFGVNVIGFESEDSWNDVSWKIGLDYKLRGGSLLYASYATGFKSGGFNAGGIGNGYDPETVGTAEVGIKSRFAGERVQLNVAGFHSDYEDKQEFLIDALGTSRLVNAAGATIWGAELEGVANITDAVTVDAAISYLNAEYDDFTTFDDLNPPLGSQDLSGNRLTRTPEWQANIGAQYRFGLSEFGFLTARVDFSFTDEKFFRPFNTASDREGSFTRTNLRLAWESVEGGITAELFVDNIENDDVAGNLSRAGGLLGGFRNEELLPPRVFGFRAGIAL